MTISDSGLLMDNESLCLPCTPEEEKRIVKQLTEKAESSLKEGNLYYVISNRALAPLVSESLQHLDLSYVLAPMEKQRRLEQILRSQESRSKVIIFCSTKKMCDQLARNLTHQFSAAVIHGDNQRYQV